MNSAALSCCAIPYSTTDHLRRHHNRRIAWCALDVARAHCHHHKGILRSCFEVGSNETHLSCSAEQRPLRAIRNIRKVRRLIHEVTLAVRNTCPVCLSLSRRSKHFHAHILRLSYCVMLLTRNCPQ